jgi:tRNA threonylcarbamoyladenosine biosynthesis protein TsaE
VGASFEHDHRCASRERMKPPSSTHYARLTSSEAATEAAGASLAATLQDGDVLLLHGDLGAGKTAFVRGVARGLGADPGAVSSPTFTIVQSYAGSSLTLVHADLYRLAPHEVDDVALDDLLAPGTVMAVEWAERWQLPPAGAIHVRLQHVGDDMRRLTITRG